VVGERWDWDGVASCPTNYVADYVTEFMYDGARQRHAVREIDVDTIGPFYPYCAVTSEVFSEYDGDTIYNDFTAVGSDVTILRSYAPGIARVDDPLGSPVTSYYHADKLGTTRGMTTAPVSLTDTSVYTAFGELVDGTNHRYGYIGSEGYQAHDEFPLLHVGARYYDPSTGRFAQRDPIGISGGLNVYVYVAGNPVSQIDPSGLEISWRDVRDAAGAVAGVIGIIAIVAEAPVVATACTVVGGVAGGAYLVDKGLQAMEPGPTGVCHDIINPDKYIPRDDPRWEAAVNDYWHGTCPNCGYPNSAKPPPPELR